MLNKTILRRYFGEYFIVGDITELIVDYESISMTGPLLEHTWKIHTYVLGLRPFEEYDAAIDFMKELSNLIDEYYPKYSIENQETLDKLYEYYYEKIFSGLCFEIRALMLESREAVDRYGKLFGEGYDRMLDSWGYYQVSPPNYCKTYSKALKYIDKKKKTSCEKFCNIANKMIDKVIHYCRPEISAASIFDYFRQNPEIRDEIFNDETKSGPLRIAMLNYLREVRQIEVTIENFEIGRELYNNLWATEEHYLKTPLDFVEASNSGDILEKIKLDETKVPKFLVELYILVVTEHYE